MKGKMLAIFYWSLILIVVCFPILMETFYLFEDINLNPNDYARITDVDYKAVVVDEPGSKGKVIVTERLTFDVHAADRANPFRELWRDLPEDYVDGVKVHYKVNSVKQILPNGMEIMYEESPRLYWEDEDYTSGILGPYKWYHSDGPYSEYERQYECVFFYVNELYREKVVYEIEYEMYNAALRYNDCSDLYVALYSGNTIKHLNSFKGQILLPNDKIPSPGNYDFYTYGTNSNTFPYTESADLNPGYYTFSFELDEDDLQFSPYNEYIEIDLVSYNEDRHIFTQHASFNDYFYDDVLDEIYQEQQKYADAPSYFTIIKAIIFLILLLLSGVTLLYALTYDKRLRQKHTFFAPTMKPEYYREIPSDLDPNFAAAFVFCKDKPPKDNSGVYSSILLSLARKKYISLYEYGEDNVKIMVEPEGTQPREPLTMCEEYYYNLLMRHMVGNCITMTFFQARVSSDYEYTQSFSNRMKTSLINIGIRDGYFQRANYTQPKDFARAMSTFLWIIGLASVILGNLISYQTRLDLAYGGWFIWGLVSIGCAIHLRKRAHQYVLLTQFGEDEYAKWRGLYNFLNSETLIHEKTYIELPLWEQYLVYATAFGLSEKVIAAIQLRCTDVAESTILSNNYCRSGNYRHQGRTFHSSVHSGSSYSGGGGGGFGYGGGGRGGGGGGGGH